MTSAISASLLECRAAWRHFFTEHGLSETAITFSDGTPIFSWCLHHEVEAEPLSEPIENRLAYILTDKPEYEQECRFLNLRPMSKTAAEVAAAALAEYDKVVAPAQAEYLKVRDSAWAEYEKVVAPAWAEYLKVRDSAWAEYEKVQDAAWAEYEKVVAAAYAEYEKVVAPAKAEYKKVRDAAQAEYLKVRAAHFHLLEVPHSTWNGKSIFSAADQTWVQ